MAIRVLLASLLLAGVGSTPALALAAAPTVVQRDGVLGTSFEMEVVGKPRHARKAVEAALAEVERLENLLSTWKADSALSSYNAGQRDRADLPADVVAVLALCETWKGRTSGAFSCRLGDLIRQWRQADKDDQLPERTALRRQARGLATLEIPASGRLDPSQGLAFDVDGIAKGYILDQAIAAARTAAPKVDGIRIDIGGDAVHWGVANGDTAWQVRIADARLPVDNEPGIAEVTLGSRAIASSGHASRGYTVGRRKFSHVLNPSDGWPLTYAASATVVAADGTSADALATALTVLPIQQGLALVDGIDGAAALIVSDGGVPFASATWSGLLAGEASQPAPQHQLLIDYAIPVPATQERYRNPYLAVWVEREDGAAVRQLHVLGDRSRWLSELPRWWRHYGRNDPISALGIARPTRAPGQYTIGWDGLDDWGRVAGPGPYVLRVEAAREHGDREELSIPFHLGGRNLDIRRKGEHEVGAIVIRSTP